MIEPLHIIAMLGAGAVAAYVNVVAGGGSLLLIPLLTALGATASVANGSIRLAIVVQGIAALWAFRHTHTLDRQVAIGLLPAVAGAALGALIIVARPDDEVRRILGGVILLAAALAAIRPRTQKGTYKLWLLIPGAALAGLYGGLVQAGVGYFFLVVATWAGAMDLSRANYAKVVWTTAYSPIALLVFARSGVVDWSSASVLAIGSAVGAVIGAKAAIKGGAKFLRWMILAAATAGGLNLFLG